MTEHDCGKTAEIERNEKDIDKIFDLIEKIRNRLPHWASISFCLLTGVIGWLLAYIKIG